MSWVKEQDAEGAELLELALETLAVAEEKLREAERARVGRAPGALAAERAAAERAVAEQTAIARAAAQQAAAEREKIDGLVCERKRLEREVLELSGLERRLRDQIEQQCMRAAKSQREAQGAAARKAPAHAVVPAAEFAAGPAAEPGHEPKAAPVSAAEPAPAASQPAPAAEPAIPKPAPHAQAASSPRREASGASEPAPAPRRPRAARIACIVLALLLAALLGLGTGAYFGILRLPDPFQSRIELLPDVNARQGHLNAAAAASPGTYQPMLNQAPVVERGSLTLPLQFENPQANAYSARLKLSLNKTGEIVASTRKVLPGTYVESVELDHALDPGSHAATALIDLYSGNTCVNTMSTAVSITAR